MLKTLEQRTLALRDIDLGDRRFMTSEYFSLERLISSIRKIGLLQPPVVAKRGRRWVLVTGWKRVLACQKLGLSFITTSIHDEPDDQKAFLFGVQENLAVREFSYLEKAEILAKLLKFGLPERKIRRKIMPWLDIPPTKSYLEGHLAIARFRPEIKRMIVEKNLPFSLAQLLAEFKADDQKAMAPLLWPLGRNKQKEILEDLREISKKTNLAPRWILGKKEIRSILKSDKWPPLQKSERVRRALRKLRFPRFSSWEMDFETAVKKLDWPKDIGLEPAPFFEDDEMTVKFRFRNEEEFMARAALIGELASKRELRELWKHEKKTRKTKA